MFHYKIKQQSYQTLPLLKSEQWIETRQSSREVTASAGIVQWWWTLCWGEQNLLFGTLKESKTGKLFNALQHLKPVFMMTQNFKDLT